jgi:cytidylate kinase
MHQKIAIFTGTILDKNRTLVIAIDGPAASGKSTTARLVAERLKYLHIDTGAMYRALTFKVIERGIDPDDTETVKQLAEQTEIKLSRDEWGNRVWLDGRDVTDQIRSPQVTSLVSKISSIPEVRALMVRQQRRMAEQGGVVLEGRDIGTVVLPEADLKIFMTANVRERAARRQKELANAGVKVDIESLEREIESRDQQDSMRKASPLRKAPDAIELDTSNLSIEQQVDFIVQRAEALMHYEQKKHHHNG